MLEDSESPSGAAFEGSEERRDDKGDHRVGGVHERRNRFFRFFRFWMLMSVL